MHYTLGQIETVLSIPIHTGVVIMLNYDYQQRPEVVSIRCSFLVNRQMYNTAAFWFWKSFVFVWTLLFYEQIWILSLQHELNCRIHEHGRYTLFAETLTWANEICLPDPCVRTYLWPYIHPCWSCNYSPGPDAWSLPTLRPSNPFFSIHNRVTCHFLIYPLTKRLKWIDK